MSYSELQKELGQNFINYAMAVNSDRSIPDARTGLKPVAKRILFSSLSKGRLSNKPHVKSARIVGDVMGELHPHGQDAIYGALIRLSQDWIMRYPLIDVHGNKGNIDGDPPAAMRYTESRLSKLSEEGMLAGIKKRNVDFMPNYDEQDEEPVTLPAIFPNLLCNPNLGIGVALATHFLPHNLKEVAQAIFDYIDGKETTFLAPDFPTGGTIINKDIIPSIIKTGKGTVKIRGNYRIEGNSIIFYEIPYEVNAESLLDEIGDLCDKKEIEGIKEIKNESNRKGIRIVLECKKGFNPEQIVQLLFMKTHLQNSISYNQVALVDGVPVEVNLEDCIKIYLKHNIDCLIKEVNFDLNKNLERLEIVNGLLKALEDIDNIILLIKESKSSSHAKERLIEKYRFSDPQAKAIVDMKLGRLAGLEKIQIQEESKSLHEEINRLKNILSSRDEQVSTIKERLNKLVQKFGDKRRTKVEQIDIPITKKAKEKAQIIPEDVVVILTRTGDIKRVPKSSFRKQKRNGVGVKTMGDVILTSISTNTVDSMLLFSSKGLLYKLSVDKIPQGTNATKGVNVNSLIQLDPNEEIIAATSLKDDLKAKYVLFFTHNGLVKRSPLEEYISIKKSLGVVAIKMKEGDSIANVLFADDNEKLVVITKNGLGVKFDISEVRCVKRSGVGVKSITLKDGDKVVAGLAIKSDKQKIGIFTENGNGKKFNIDELPIQARGGKGVIINKIDSDVVGAAAIENDDDLLLLNGSNNSICIDGKSVPLVTRTFGGAAMIKGDIQKVVKL